MRKMLAGFVLAVLVSMGVGVAVARSPTSPSIESVEVGTTSTLSTLPVTVTLTDAKTGVAIRNERFQVPVNLNQFGDKTKSASTFLTTSKTAASDYIKQITTSYEKPYIEEIDSSFQVTLNVGVKLNEIGFTERVRLYLDGLSYTILSPSSSPLEVLLTDIQANVLTAYGGTKAK